MFGKSIYFSFSAVWGVWALSLFGFGGEKSPIFLPSQKFILPCVCVWVYKKLEKSEIAQQ